MVFLIKGNKSSRQAGNSAREKEKHTPTIFTLKTKWQVQQNKMKEKQFAHGIKHSSVLLSHRNFSHTE